MRIDVVTTFPELFTPAAPGVLGVSIPARAIAAGKLDVHAHQLRDYTDDKHQKTDDRPFGGGPGMVMLAQPLWDAVHAIEPMDPRPATRILLTPQGETLTQARVEDLAARPRLLLIPGHYEGIDERAIEALAPLELSIGDYVLSGGELAALVLIDALARLQPGVLGDDDSAAQDSFSPPADTDPVGSPLPKKTLAAIAREFNLDPARLAPDADPPLRLLDCPHYTRPRDWQGREAPPVLLSGDHQSVAAWRLRQRLERTQTRRPDLLEGSRDQPSATSDQPGAPHAPNSIPKP